MYNRVILISFFSNNNICEKYNTSCAECNGFTSNDCKSLFELRYIFKLIGT